MTTPENPKHIVPPIDADFELTDGGWDPYVTSLMLEATGERTATSTD